MTTSQKTKDGIVNYALNPALQPNAGQPTGLGDGTMSFAATPDQDRYFLGMSTGAAFTLSGENHGTAAKTVYWTAGGTSGTWSAPPGSSSTSSVWMPLDAGSLGLAGTFEARFYENDSTGALLGAQKRMV